MSSFAAIRAGIATTLAPLNDPGVLIGGQRQPVFVSPYVLDNPIPPVIMVEGIDEIDYNSGGPLKVNVLAHVGLSTEQGAQAILDELLMSATTVQSLLMADRDLGGAVGNLRVQSASGHKVFKVSPTSLVLGAIWVVQMTLLD